MAETQTTLPQPTTIGSNLSPTDYLWLLLVQVVSPLIEVDSSGGPVTIALPEPGANTSTGQTAQNQELIYVKTSSDGNAITITGALSGTATLTAQWSKARFKSNATDWIQVG